MARYQFRHSISKLFNLFSVTWNKRMDGAELLPTLTRKLSNACQIGQVREGTLLSSFIQARYTEPSPSSSSLDFLHFTRQHTTYIQRTFICMYCCGEQWPQRIFFRYCTLFQKSCRHTIMELQEDTLATLTGLTKE